MLIFLAAFGVVVLIFRAAKNRGRQGWLWAMFGAIAAVVGTITGTLVFVGLSVSSTDDGVGEVMFGYLLSLVGPFVFMAAVLALLYWLPESVPTVRGLKWAVHRMAMGTKPGVDCVLMVENGVLQVDDVRVDLKEVSEIAADGECLRLAWPSGSVLLLPTGAERSAAERSKRSQGLVRRLIQVRAAS